MRITDNIINTIKFIGQIEWRLQEQEISFELVPRWKIKQWVFNTHNDMAIKEIKKKIEYAAKRKEAAGEQGNSERRPSFIYVDDRVVKKAMKIRWGIDKPKVGQRAPFGLKSHSWQALAVATYYADQQNQATG